MFTSMLLLFGLPMLISGKIDVSKDPFILKVLALAITYFLSIYLVFTLPGKTTKRRVFSWAQSILFHSSLLVYLAFFSNWGVAIFLIGFIEILVLLLSATGLMYLAYEHAKNDVV